LNSFAENAQTSQVSAATNLAATPSTTGHLWTMDATLTMKQFYRLFILVLLLPSPFRSGLHVCGLVCYVSQKVMNGI